MLPSDRLAVHFPVSIKAVVSDGERVALLRNEREEWAIPGGKLEKGESPLECCEREVLEELHFPARVVFIIDSWLYNILDKAEVLIVTYGCAPLKKEQLNSLRVSHEHKELRLFAFHELDALSLPLGYRKSIDTWKQITSLPTLR